MAAEIIQASSEGPFNPEVFRETTEGDQIVWFKSAPEEAPTSDEINKLGKEFRKRSAKTKRLIDRDKIHPPSQEILDFVLR